MLALGIDRRIEYVETRPGCKDADAFDCWCNALGLAFSAAEGDSSPVGGSALAGKGRWFSFGDEAMWFPSLIVTVCCIRSSRPTIRGWSGAALRSGSTKAPRACKSVFPYTRAVTRKTSATSCSTDGFFASEKDAPATGARAEERRREVLGGRAFLCLSADWIALRRC